jgi:general secretion pathway protein B
VPDPGAESTAESPVEDQLARYAAVPVLRQLPREFRRSVPELDISIHVYDIDPHWRFVRINKQKFLEGDQVAKDLTLEAITPGGLVLVYQGTAFQLAKP